MIPSLRVRGAFASGQSVTTDTGGQLGSKPGGTHVEQEVSVAGDGGDQFLQELVDGLVVTDASISRIAPVCVCVCVVSLRLKSSPLRDGWCAASTRCVSRW